MKAFFCLKHSALPFNRLGLLFILLVFLTLGLLLILTPKNAYASSTQSNSQHWFTAFYNGVPYPNYLSNSITLYTDQIAYDYETSVTHAIWSSQVPNILVNCWSNPTCTDTINSSLDIVDSNNNSNFPPNNNPYCFVNATTLAICGDSGSMNEYINNSGGRAYASIIGTICTYDDYNQCLQFMDAWSLNSF